MTNPPGAPAEAGVRIDRWLWAARFFRTRTLGKKALDAGRVRINGARVKPSRHVVVGDTLSISRESGSLTVTVLRLSEKRASAVIAQALYQESDESKALREAAVAAARLERQLHAAPDKRPDRRARRDIQRLKRD